MKLTNDQFEASAYIFEKANGNKKSEYEEKIIAESGLNNLTPIELETQIINGIDNGLYSDSNERISAYWSLSKIHKAELIPNFKKWLKIELENENADTVYPFHSLAWVILSCFLCCYFAKIPSHHIYLTKLFVNS